VRDAAGSGDCSGDVQYVLRYCADTCSAESPLLRMSSRPGQQRAVWALGAAQCVLWGVLYYGYTVLLLPLQAELGATRPQLAGAFSLGLLLMALTAPVVGRHIDAGQGTRVMRFGVMLATVGLVALACVSSLPALYAVWALLGVAMACALYESALGLVLRAFDDAGHRLHALSSVTVLGGLASTVFLPVLAWGVECIGWRATALASAVAVVVAGAALERWVYRPLAPSHAQSAPLRVDAATRSNLLPFHAYAVAGTLAAMALAILLVPLLVDRGMAPASAASLLALLGVSQLPGRLYLMRAQALSPTTMALLPLALQGAGLLLVAWATTLWAIGGGVVIFGLGAGLHTLARPWLVERRVGRFHAGTINARLARTQGVARAAGPLVATLAAEWLNGTLALCLLGIALFVILPAMSTLASE
jgi:MFS family permease